MAKQSYYKQLVVRVYEQPYKDLKAIASQENEAEAEIIRKAIDRYIAYAKKKAKQDG